MRNKSNGEHKNHWFTQPSETNDNAGLDSQNMSNPQILIRTEDKLTMVLILVENLADQ